MKFIYAFLFLIIISPNIFAGSLQEIRTKNEIKIGVRKNFPPLSILDNGEFKGFEVELAKKLGEIVLGNKDGKITLVGLEAKDRIPMLKNEEIDMAVANFSKTPEREKLVDFSAPYFTTYLSILSKKDKKIGKISDFSGKVLLVNPGTTSEEYINKYPDKFRGIEIKNCDNFRDCFDKLQNGLGDGYFHTILALGAAPIIDNSFEISIKQVSTPDFIAVGFKKGNDELKKIINEAIYQLSKDGFFKHAYNDNLNVYYKGTMDSRLFLLDDIYSYFITQ